MECVNKVKKEDIIFGFMILTISLFRLFLGINTLLIVRANWGHDDGLMISQAINIISGNWLGDWNGRVLIKGGVYPFFLVLCYKIGIAYPVALYLLWIVASLICIVAIKPIVKSKWVRLILYIFLLFSPTMFNYNTVQYIYRNAIIPATSVLVVSSFTGMFLRRKNKKSLIAWLVLSGISISFFYYICENSIWLGIFAIGATVITGIYMWKELQGGKGKLKLVLLVIPFIMLFITRGAFSYLNYINYGTTALNSRSDTYFKEMMENMLLVERAENETDTACWITSSMMDDIIEASSTLQSIELYINEAYEAWGCEGRQIHGDFTQWVMIDAMERAGIYDSFEEADEFCKNVAQELETAFEDGTLKKTSEKQIYLSSTARGIGSKDISELIERMGISFTTLTTYDCAESIQSESTGNCNTISQISDVLGTTNLDMPTQYSISGWAFACDDDVELTAKFLNDKQDELQEIEFQESPDVYNQYEEYSNSQVARFNLNVSDDIDEIYYIAFYLDGEWCETMNVEDQRLNNDKIVVNIDSYPGMNKEIKGNSITTNVQNISNFVISIYKVFALPFVLLGCLGYILLTWKTFFNIDKEEKKNNITIWLIISGMLVSFMALLVGNCWYMSFYTGEVYKWKIFNYGIGGVVIFQIIEGLCIIKLVDILKIKEKLLNKFLHERRK